MNSSFSLLWTETAVRSLKTNLDGHPVTDLNLTRLIQHLSPSTEYEPKIKAILLNLCQDETVIQYRQSILEDLLRSPVLVKKLESVLVAIAVIAEYMIQPQWRDNALQQVAWRLSELENYVECVVLFDAVLCEAGENLESEGLLTLHRLIHELAQEQSFRQLQTELPELLAKIRGIGSITVGINLDGEMRPTTATLLSANNFRFKSASMIGRLFGKAPNEDESPNGLHNSRYVNSGGSVFEVELRRTDSPFMPPLFRDLTMMLEDICRPIIQALKKYTYIHSQLFVALQSELAFYLGAVNMMNTIQEAGLPFCKPEIAPPEDRAGQITGLYNLNLALLLKKQKKPLSEIVKNDADFGAEGRIFIVTGPNQGGKTTYTQAVGLVQILFQAGLYVPADAARMSVADGIYTHFATEERPDAGTGRLGEEAQRLSEIFQRATRHSLILLNESLASTGVTEGVHLARDVVRALRVLGARAIFATHLHDLALECDSINATTPGDSPVASLISLVEIEENEQGAVVKRTYRIIPGAPAGRSYAIELAARYGISYQQLMETLKQRKVL